MSYYIEKYISVETVDEFICNLYRARCNWINLFEYSENYDYFLFSQKPSDGLEKYETIIKGSKIIFSVLPDGEDIMYNLEIIYDDKQEYIYELPYLNDKEIKTRLKALLDDIHKQDSKKYEEMNKKLFNLLD